MVITAILTQPFRPRLRETVSRRSLFGSLPIYRKEVAGGVKPLGGAGPGASQPGIQDIPEGVAQEVDAKDS